MCFSQNRVRPFFVGIFAATFAITGLVAQTQQSKEDEAKAEKRRQEEFAKARKEMQPVMQLVDTGMAGQAMPSDFPVQWHNDFLKASDLKAYVPFTLTIPGSSLTTNSVGMYIRVVPKTAAAPASGEDAKKAAQTYPWEDIQFVDTKAGPDGAVRFSRAFVVPSGDFDVFVALRERGKREGAKTSVLKQAVTVPDLYSELTTGSLILTSKRVEPLPGSLSREEQIKRPYAAAGMDIEPKLDAKISKTAELNLFFPVYNPAVGPDQKPNLLIEYLFYQKTGETEKYFNKTAPQEWSAKTLPPEFSAAQGHAIPGGVDVPLASFAEGDFRLEIKITDKISGKTLTRNLNFTVVA